MWSVGLLLLHIVLRVDAVPAVTSLTPDGVIVSGGISITIIGARLLDDSQPKTVITATYTNGSSTVTEVFTGSACTVETHVKLVCPSPQISLTKFTDIGYIVPTDAKIRLINDDKLAFRIGVSWNSFKSAETFKNINVYKDPSVAMQNPQRTYTVWTNRVVNMYGNDLNKYVLDKTEYDISVSNLKCPVMYFNATFMWCLLPTTSPVPNDADKLHSIVTLKVGDFSEQLGRIWYRIPTFYDNITGSPEIFYPNDPTDKISINGTNFMVAITSGNTYYIQIGQGECTNIELTATVIKCRPPDIQPTPITTLPQLNNYPQIVVTVPRIASTAAHQYTQHLGYVQYSDKVFTVSPSSTTTGSSDTSDNTNGSDPWNSLWKWVILGIAFFLGLLFLGLLICCICCYPEFRNRRAWQNEEKFYPDERNTSAHSSFRSYKSKTTSDTYLHSDGSREYYVTEQRLPRNYRY